MYDLAQAFATSKNRAYSLSSMDDPILWGILPLSYMFNPDNLRWGLGSYDLCFTNKYVQYSLHALHTDKTIEGFLPSSHWDRSCLPIDPHTHRTAASSSPP